MKFLSLRRLPLVARLCLRIGFLISPIRRRLQGRFPHADNFTPQGAALPHAKALVYSHGHGLERVVVDGIHGDPVGIHVVREGVPELVVQSPPRDAREGDDGYARDHGALTRLGDEPVHVVQLRGARAAGLYQPGDLVLHERLVRVGV